MSRVSIAARTKTAAYPTSFPYDLTGCTKAFIASVCVIWMRNWERVIVYGAPHTLLEDGSYRQFAEFDSLDAPQRLQEFEILLVSFGERFMTEKRVLRWAKERKLRRFAHPRAIAAIGENVTPFLPLIEERGRIGFVAPEPTVTLKDGMGRRACVLYARRAKDGNIERTLSLDLVCTGWSGDHFIGFDVTEGGKK